MDISVKLSAEYKELKLRETLKVEKIIKIILKKLLFIIKSIINKICLKCNEEHDISFYEIGRNVCKSCRNLQLKKRIDENIKNIDYDDLIDKHNKQLLNYINSTTKL